jgi:NAD(P)H dehydrogenase (quinone)
MKIGISGASGHLGSATVRELKARIGAKDIVAISRTPDKLAGLDVETRAGDFDKPETLTEAFCGLDKLLLIPTVDPTPGARSRQLGAAIEKAVSAGVGHITFVSAVGVRAAQPPDLNESYFVPEQALMRKANQWSIVRMAFFSESFLDQAKMSLAQGVHASSSSVPVNFVSRDDVAAACAGVLATEGHHGAIYNATGPEALDGPARAAVVAEITRKPFAFVQVTAEQYAEGLKAAGLPPAIINAVLSIQDMWARGAFDITTGDVLRLTGRAPRRLADVAEAYLTGSRK